MFAFSCILMQFHCRATGYYHLQRCHWLAPRLQPADGTWHHLAAAVTNLRLRWQHVIATGKVDYNRQSAGLISTRHHQKR